MRDFPAFATDNGVGSLVLHNIPCWGMAYLTVQSASDPNSFLKDCVSFCRAAGADHLYASGLDTQAQYPFYAQILQMSASREGMDRSSASLFPVTENTASKWRDIYNDKMRKVPGASYMNEEKCEKLYRAGEAYFIHQKGTLLGIGAADSREIKAVASVCPGGGKAIVNALAEIMSDDVIVLSTASENKKAVSLYKSLGFVETGILKQWYKIF